MTAEAPTLPLLGDVLARLRQNRHLETFWTGRNRVTTVQAACGDALLQVTLVVRADRLQLAVVACVGAERAEVATRDVSPEGLQGAVAALERTLRPPPAGPRARAAGGRA